MWTRGRIHRLLINEKYRGNNVWARTSLKLKQPSMRNAPAHWVRADGAFPAIVDQETFDRTQTIIAARADGISDQHLLDALRRILAERGTLSGTLLDQDHDAPCSTTYFHRFGGLLRAYELIGFKPRRDFRYLDANQQLRDAYRDVIAQVIDGFRSVGASIDQDPATDLLTINHEFTVSLIIARCLPTPAGSLRWKVRFDAPLKPDLTVAIRMDAANMTPIDYYVLPLRDGQKATLRLAMHNGLWLDAFRCDTLDGLYAMARRRTWPLAA